MKELIIEVLSKHSCNIDSISGVYSTVVDYDDWNEIADKINQRHEEAIMKAKEIAFEAWMIQFNGDQDAIDYFFGSKENMRKAFDEWYDKKYETNELRRPE